MAEGKQFVFGINPVLEKLRAAPTEIAQIILTRGSGSESGLKAIETEAKRLGVRISYAAPRVLDVLAKGRKHQGVLAEMAPYSYAVFSDLLQGLRSLGETDGCWLLLLDGLTDPQNFGAVLRTAEAVGVRHVVIPKDRSCGVTPAVVKASSGAVYHIKIYRVTNLRRAMASLKQHGFWIVGLDPGGDQRIYDRIHPRKLAIVLGSEGAGIRPLIRRECDYIASIPMTGKIASLNVSVAGAVFLYELFRQRNCVDNPESKR